jgi:leucyl/phenylalanyl-tRNA--protein transferase
LSGLTPEILLQAYRQGIFPMSESRDDPEIFWVDPRWRGVIPLGYFRISRSLARTLRRGRFRISYDTDFAAVIDGCADRPETWINPVIRDLCLDLHQSGHAHAIEVWQGDELVGGVYGIHIGGAFFGESMFSRARDASKVALAYLLAGLQADGFSLFDTQFLTPHLASLGGIEIGRVPYQRALARALDQSPVFSGRVLSVNEVMQRSTQTS